MKPIKTVNSKYEERGWHRAWSYTDAINQPTNYAFTDIKLTQTKRSLKTGEKLLSANKEKHSKITLQKPQARKKHI